MAEQIKKGFFKVLPWSVAMFMIFSISLGVWYSLPVEPAKAAALAPLTVTYRDVGGNGEVETIRLTFTDVTACTYEAGDWAVGVAGTVGVTGVTGFSNAGSCIADDFIDVTVTVSTTDTTGGAVNPRLDYTDAGVAGSVVADANQDAANFTATDLAPPLVLTATYLDNDGSGEVDRVRLNTTTDVGIVCTAFAGGVDFTVGTAGDVGVAAAGGDTCASNGTSTVTITLATAGTTDTTGGTTAPVVSYTQPGNGVEDGAGNDLPTAAGVTVADGAAPIIVNTYSADPDNDGDVNAVDIAFSENISDATVTVASFEFDNDNTNNATGEETASGGSSTVVYPGADADANDQYYRLTATTGITGTELAYLHMTAAGLSDGTNLMATGSALGTENDEADPIVMSTSPADNATDVALDASFSITFSEAMTTASITGAISRSPSFTLGTAAWTVSDTVVTYASHDAWAGLQNYIITLAGTIASAAAGDGNLDLTAVVANPYDFTTVAATGGGGGTGGLPASITVTAPNGGETLTGGGTYNVTWSTTGTITDTINIYYSTDSGINFPNTVATAETNDGAYTWTVPNTATGTVKIKVATGSLNDISDANFSITYSASAVSTANSTVSATPTSVVANGTSKSTVTVTVKDASSNLLSGKVVTLASSRGSSDTITTVTGTTGANGVATFEVKSSTAGTSTYTATAAGVVLSQTVSVVFSAPGETPPVGETPVSLSVGDLIKSSLSTSVYYYGSDGKRHLFPNEKTYKSWYVDFSGIKNIPASQLQGITLGHNVTVRPGTVLLKIQTDPKVYAVEPGGLLRWVPTEARASTLYGSAWATKIIDVPLVFWVDYTFGSDITTDKHPTGAVIQYTGTTDKYYVEGAEKRLISTAGFTANKFQLSNVLSVPTSITYTLGTPLVAEETVLTRIY